MKYIIDTDIAIDYLRNKPEAVEFLNELSQVVICTLTVAELYYGVYHSANQEKHLKTLQKFLAGTIIVDFTVEKAHIFGAIKDQLQKQGKISSDFDLAIAATCLAHQVTLVTRNIKHYQNIPELKLETI